MDPAQVIRGCETHETGRWTVTCSSWNADPSEHGPIMTKTTRRRSVLAIAVALTASLFAGCNTTKYYERKHHSDEVMILAADPTEAHFLQKCYYSREGSAGGIGTSAGGGCGCY